MDDGAGPDDDLAWDPPTGPPPPEPQPPPPAASAPEPPTPGWGRPPPEAVPAERGGAALAAGLFGALAGITLPPLLFWTAISLFVSFGLPDTGAAVAALVVAFGVPLLLFARVMGQLGRSSPRYDRARTALTIAASVSMGMWLFLAAVVGFVVVVLRSMS